MQPQHFIAILQDTYETAYSVTRDPELPLKFRAPLAEKGILAANECCANNWGDQARAGQIAGSLLRLIHGERASEEAAGLNAWVMLSVTSTSDPLLREQMQGAPTPGPISPIQP